VAHLARSALAVSALDERLEPCRIKPLPGAQHRRPDSVVRVSLRSSACPSLPPTKGEVLDVRGVNFIDPNRELTV
jgi:hypothetical protein